MAYFTHYWTGRTVEMQQRLGASKAIREKLVHTAGEQFHARGVKPGDTIYVISFSGGRLRVIARLVVDRIVDEQTAQRQFTTELWDASEHVLAHEGSGTPPKFDRWLDDATARTIEFVGADGGIGGPALNRRGELDPQTFRGVRQITPRTATLFDKALS